MDFCNRECRGSTVGLGIREFIYSKVSVDQVFGFRRGPAEVFAVGAPATRALGPATMTPVPSCPAAAAVNAWTWARIRFSLSIWPEESPASAELWTAFLTSCVLSLVVMLCIPFRGSPAYQTSGDQ